MVGKSMGVTIACTNPELLADFWMEAIGLTK